MNYLKNKQEYIDRYDLWTIKDCSRWYWGMKDAFTKDRNKKIFKKYTDEEFDEEVSKVLHRVMLAIKTQWFRDKEKTIDKWMEEDRKLQKK